MNKRLQISLFSTKRSGLTAAVRCVSIRKRLLRFLLGQNESLTIIVPGDAVEELSIHELAEKG